MCNTTEEKCRSPPALVEVSLDDVSYEPMAMPQRRRVKVLSHVSTSIRPFQLTAWMGPSGSGKTSLISVAAGLVDDANNITTGRVKINNEIGRIPKQLAGVVWQDDLLLSNLTVYENLYFAARLKTSVPDETVQKLVHDTMEELGISHIADRVVGSAESRGVSGGERKRVSVGSELVVRPSLLLCDEPTSGLDSTTAQSLIRTLKDLCKSGHSIVVVIHQPRAGIYTLFDHLLLLSRGRVLFDGPPTQARPYLEESHGELPPETGLADWLMDIVTEDEQTDGRLANKWEKTKNKITFDNQKEKDYALCSLDELKAGPKYYTSVWAQFKLLTLRTMKQQRGERLTLTSVILQMAYLFFTALFWWRLENSTGRIFERNSLLFFMLIAQSNSIVIVAVSVFQRERILLSRERAKKMYTVSSYFLAKTLSDMTNNVLLPLLYTAAVYWTGNFRVTASAFFKFLFSFYWTFSTAQSMGLFLSILIPSQQIAMILAPSITLFFIIMGGFYIPLENLHAGVRWASYLSFARYGYSSLVYVAIDKTSLSPLTFLTSINEYQNREISCAENVAISIGGSDLCPLPGDEVIFDLGIRGVAESYWFNIGMVIILQVLFRAAAYALLRTKR